MKYIYFELNKINGYNETEITIENPNILMIEPNTNSDGFWGFTNITERHGFPTESSVIVNQNWVNLDKYDLNKYTNPKHPFYKLDKHIKECIEILKTKLETSE